MKSTFSVILALGIFISLFYNNCATSGDWESSGLTGVALVEEELKYSDDGLVKVFLEFDSTANTDKSGLSGKASVSTNKLTILNILNKKMQSKLSKTGRDSVAREYKYINFVATTLDKETLNELKESGAVKSFTIQREYATSMIESNTLTGVDALHSENSFGSGVSVAVIDSGIQVNHPALRDNVVGGACFASDCGANGTVGKSAGASCDGCSHGTHVAGIIAGNSSQLKGVAPGAGIYSIRVFAGKGAEKIEESIVQAIEHVIEKASTHNIVAVNLSIGTTGYKAKSKYECKQDHPQWAAVLEKLDRAGVVAFIASGNDLKNHEISAPGCMPKAVAVGSSNKSDGHQVGSCSSAGEEDSISCFSNQANWLEFVAPGRNIRSSVDGSSYSSKSGTSMATPNVAGMFALLKAKHPSVDSVDVLGAMKLSSVKITDPRTNSVLDRPQVDSASNLISQRRSLYYIDSIASGEVMGKHFDVTSSGEADLVHNIKAHSGEYLRFDKPLLITPNRLLNGSYNLLLRHPSLSAPHKIRVTIGSESKVVDLEYLRKSTFIGSVDYSVSAPTLKIEPVSGSFIFDRLEIIRAEAGEFEFTRINLAGQATNSVLEVNQPNMNSTGSIKLVTDVGTGDKIFYWYKDGKKVTQGRGGKILLNDVGGSTAGSYYVEYESEISRSSVRSNSVEVVPVNATSKTLLQFTSRATRGMKLKVYYQGSLIAVDEIEFANQVHNIVIPASRVDTQEISMEVTQ